MHAPVPFGRGRAALGGTLEYSPGAGMSAPKVLFYVQHLLGIGHVKRATTLARAMAGVGLDVTVVSGGGRVPVVDAAGMRFVQLPALRASDRTFGALVDENNVPVSEALKAERREFLLQCLADTRPDALVLELYPFGRRQSERSNN